jgi:DNA polymerase
MTNQQSQLSSIIQQVLNCRKCSLHKTRKNAVPGEGNPQAEIMLIGEAPGYWEDVKGRPFVGAAGKFLDTLLAEAELTRQKVYITNILKCRPPKNRPPQQAEIQKCTPYLDKQITTIKPKIIITLGNYATNYIFSKANIPFNGITQTHGKPYKAIILNLHMTLFPTFHPAAALHNPRYKKLLLEDFQKLKQILNQI